ncbi:MAG: hypothetical protein ACRD0U_12140 [Acidimicrobiales bacterium]
MSTRSRVAKGEQGQAVGTLVVVVLVVAVAALLLNRTAWTAESINRKAANISESGEGINQSTGAVIQLSRTNELAASIVNSAKPLEAKLAEVVRLAQSIDGLAQSINGTAGSINGTAGAINDTAKGINVEAANILQVAASINRGVEQINRNLDTTIGIASQIKSDTGNILGQATDAHTSAACIDQGLLGAPDGDCR